MINSTLHRNKLPFEAGWKPGLTEYGKNLFRYAMIVVSNSIVLLILWGIFKVLPAPKVETWKGAISFKLLVLVLLIVTVITGSIGFLLGRRIRKSGRTKRYRGVGALQAEGISVRIRWIDVITSPLGFFATALLIVETFLGAVLVEGTLQPHDKTVVIWAGLFMLVLVIALTTILVWFKPAHIVLTTPYAGTADRTAMILRRFWKPDGSHPLKQNENRLRDWLRDNQLESISMTVFLTASIFVEERSRAVGELGIISERMKDSETITDIPSFNVGSVAKFLTEPIFAEARSRALVTNIPSSDVEDVCRDFLSENANVKAIPQPDGSYAIEAEFAH